MHLAVHNNANLTGVNYSRMQQFAQVEKQTLQPLYPYLFEPMTVHLSTVNKYGHTLAKCRQALLQRTLLIGKRLRIKYTTTRLQVYDNNEVVAVHERFLGKGFKYITIQDHLATQHKYLAAWSPQKFMATLDDFGIQAFDASGRSFLMDIVEDRQGKHSTIIASQVPVKNWYDVIGEQTVADAILDRLVHQSVRIELKGESLRKNKKENNTDQFLINVLTIRSLGSNTTLPCSLLYRKFQQLH